LSEGWNPIQAYWKNPSAENRAALRAFLKPEATQWQYMHGVPSPERLSPDSWTLDSALLARPGNDEIQLDLFGDYQSNVALYPKFQEYIRTRRPPLLAVWGKNDPFFLPAGAQAFKRDNPDAKSTCSRLVISRSKARDSRSRRSSATSSSASCRNRLAPPNPQLILPKGTQSCPRQS
jgi:hypothetical protein